MSDPIKAFTDKVKAHDLTYQFSDDHRYWLAGEASLKEILQLARQIPPHSRMLVWNSVVDEKMAEGHRQQFYWRESWLERSQ